MTLSASFDTIIQGMGKFNYDNYSNFFPKESCHLYQVIISLFLNEFLKYYLIEFHEYNAGIFKLT